MKDKILVIGGPTASGKSSAAMECAKVLGGEIVSADSMQLYRHMDIGTAKPSAEDMREVPHHMIDLYSPDENADLADYCARAREEISDIISRSKLPIICGGTGLYIDTLISGTVLSDSASSPEIRERLTEFAREYGNGALHRKLREVDPESAEAIHENNVRRVIRALEIYEATGITKTEWDERSRTEAPYDVKYFVLSYKNREILYSRIDSRVDMMMRDGLEAEAKFLYDSGYLTPEASASQAIGYKEFVPYFRGEISLSDAVEEIKRASRSYAKRQMTWFKRNRNAIQIETEGDTSAAVCAILREWER